MSGKKNQKQKENDLKKELVLDVHTVTVEELSERFKSDVETGLSSQQAKEGNDQFGLNELTPPPTTPEWVKFLKNLFTGFSMLLWAAAIFATAVA